MNSVCVVGNGQLGRMLRLAGEPLGINVYPIGLDENSDTVSYQQSVITAEIECWPKTARARELANHPNFINRDSFAVITDRQSQKKLIDKLRLPTAQWVALSEETNWSDLFFQLGETLIIKRRTGGYDGRGQFRVTAQNSCSLPHDMYDSCIIEACIPFDAEVSLIGARNRQGDCIFYPLTHNYHEQGILKVSMVELAKVSCLQGKAETMLKAIMEELNYIGVMAMECFVVNGNLLINELAPRVHNSGHWTQNGASVSQFELHLRAILDLPLIKPCIAAISVMINLIGLPINYAWLNSPLIHLHWYDKTVRDNRKVGHLNLVHSDRLLLLENLKSISSLLPDSYQKSMDWVCNRLQD